MKRFIVSLVLVCLPLSGLGHLKSAKNLKAVCDSMRRGQKNANECNSYIHGVYDAIEGTLACPPDGTTHEQKVHVVRHFLEAHARRLHEHEANLVVEALQEAYPCPKP